MQCGREHTVVKNIIVSWNKIKNTRLIWILYCVLKLTKTTKFNEEFCHKQAFTLFFLSLVITSFVSLSHTNYWLTMTGMVLTAGYAEMDYLLCQDNEIIRQLVFMK